MARHPGPGRKRAWDQLKQKLAQEAICNKARNKLLDAELMQGFSAQPVAKIKYNFRKTQDLEIEQCK